MKGLFKANLYIAVMITNNGHKVVQVCFTAFHCVKNKMYNVSVIIRNMFNFMLRQSVFVLAKISEKAFPSFLF